VVLHSFYVQLLLINFVLVLIGKFDQKSNFHPRLDWTRLYKSRKGPKHGEKVVFKSRE